MSLPLDAPFNLCTRAYCVPIKSGKGFACGLHKGTGSVGGIQGGGTERMNARKEARASLLISSASCGGVIVPGIRLQAGGLRSKSRSRWTPPATGSRLTSGPQDWRTRALSLPDVAWVVGNATLRCSEPLLEPFGERLKRCEFRPFSRRFCPKLTH